MKRRGAYGFRWALALGLLVAAACGPKRVAAPSPLPTPAPRPASLFVLLPDDRGRPNLAFVTNPAGTADLRNPYTALRVVNASTAPAGPAPLDPVVVRQIFGAALDVLPAEELAFNLYFLLGTVTLSPESESLIPGLLQAVRERRSTILTVTGHTDTTGVSREANYHLGLNRANTVAERLRAAGIDPQSLVIRSHGQDDLLVATPANTPQPENRRVEVIVR